MADKKITELTELTAVAGGDMAVIVDDPSGSSETKKITRDNFIGSETITMAANKQILADDTGGVSAPPVAFDGDTDTGMYRVGANQAGFSAGGVKQGGFDTDGMLLAGNRVIINNVQLTGSTADGFPTNTTLSVFNFKNTSSGNEVSIGGVIKTMTLTGTLTQTATPLAIGTAPYNTFDGTNDYLECTDTNFANMTNTFSVGGWVYQSDWSAIATNNTIIARKASVNGNGWFVALSGTDLHFYTNAGTTDQYYSMAKYASGWHHFVYVVGATTVTLYVDGVAVKTFTLGTLTAGGTFTLGSLGDYDRKFAGALYDVFIDTAVALTSDNVRNIYARSAKKFSTKDSNGQVNIQKKYKTLIQSSYPTTTSASGDHTNITCATVIIPENNEYTLKGSSTSYASAATNNSAEAYIKINGTTVSISTPASLVANGWNIGSAHWCGALKSGDVVTWVVSQFSTGGTAYIRGDNNNIKGTSLIVESI